MITTSQPKKVITFTFIDEEFTNPINHDGDSISFEWNGDKNELIQRIMKIFGNYIHSLEIIFLQQPNENYDVSFVMDGYYYMAKHKISWIY